VRRLFALASCAVLPVACAGAPPEDLPEGPAHVAWSCDFDGSYCGMVEQSKVEPRPRSSFVRIERGGRPGVKLTTLPGDDQVHGSGTWERNDLELPPSRDYCNEGQDEWWSVSVLFPDDYVEPVLGEVMDFHGNASHGQANLNLVSARGELRLHGFYGDVDHPGEYREDLGRIRRNHWYDFVYHVKWSSGGDGFMVAWMNGRKVLVHHGPTLYPGISCYFKLANYHTPSRHASSIVFGRVARGSGPRAVTLARLER
jgi:hypothetical protein